jgi:hypothetical protein
MSRTRKRYTIWIDETAFRVRTAKPKKAARELVQAGDYGKLESTCWVDARITARGVDYELRSIAVDPGEPECDSEHEHDWHETGVQGHGGGVMVYETCRHCGVERVTDTWAQRPDTGEQGLLSISYEQQS